MTERFSPQAAAVDREIMRGVPRKPAPPAGTHLVEHHGEKESISCPTLPITARRLARHRDLYGSEGSDGM